MSGISRIRRACCNRCWCRGDHVTCWRRSDYARLRRIKRWSTCYNSNSWRWRRRHRRCRRWRRRLPFHLRHARCHARCHGEWCIGCCCCCCCSWGFFEDNSLKVEQHNHHVLRHCYRRNQIDPKKYVASPDVVASLDRSWCRYLRMTAAPSETSPLQKSLQSCDHSELIELKQRCSKDAGTTGIDSTAALGDMAAAGSVVVAWTSQAKLGRIAASLGPGVYSIYVGVRVWGADFTVSLRVCIRCLDSGSWRRNRRLRRCARRSSRLPHERTHGSHRVHHGVHHQRVHHRIHRKWICKRHWHRTRRHAQTSRWARSTSPSSPPFMTLWPSRSTDTGRPRDEGISINRCRSNLSLAMKDSRCELPVLMPCGSWRLECHGVIFGVLTLATVSLMSGAGVLCTTHGFSRREAPAAGIQADLQFGVWYMGNLVK